MSISHVAGGRTAVAPARRVRLLSRSRFARRYLHNKPAVAGMLVLIAFVLVALLEPLLMPMDPDKQDLSAAFANPFTPGHLLGADNLGRDVLSRLIAADRVAIFAATQALVVALAIGVPLGFLAAMGGRWADIVIQRITDAVQSLPPLMLAIALLGAIGPGLRNAMIVIGIVFSPGFIRLVRASVLEVLSETYIEASRSIGTPVLRMIRTRVVANAFPPVLVQMSIVMGLALIAEASLSLLGLGVAPPQASWGLMIAQGYNFLYQQPWLVVIPGITLAVAVLALNLVGDGLRDSIGRVTNSEGGR